uniref:Uncharacterized protein n=1 Tax=Corvus moneduloides TaxID=1196302 RepID=A0A8C3DL55_CORMO
MASKRYLQPADPVIFNKLPHLDPTASFLPSKIPGRSSSVPHPGSENHFSYKGSYFACPLQSPEGPEQPPAHWSPAPTYLHHGPGAMSQPVPAEGPLLGFLLHSSESLGARLQPPDALKSKDSLSQEQLMARKKLDSPRCPLPVKKPVLVNKAAPLAVPKPVYGAPASFLAPRMALLLGTRADSLQQRPGEANWALPPTTHPLHPGEPHKRGPCSDHSLPPLPSSLVLPSKEQLASPVALPAYYATFDKYGPPPGTSFLEARCPTPQSQKKVPEVSSLSPDPWPKLQPPEASPVNRERSAVCYPPSPYPLSPRRAGPLCHPPAPTAGEPSALPGFGYVGSRELFPSTYLKAQAPRSYFPSPLDPYVPRTAGARLGAVLRDAEPPRDAELLRNTGYPGFAVSPGDASVFRASFPGTEPGCEQHRADSPQWRAASRHSSAFQPVCTSEKLPGGCAGLAETFPKREGSWEKPRQGEEEPLYPGRRSSSPAPQDTPRVGPGKGNACKVKDPAKELIRPSPSVTPTKGLEDQRDTKAFSSSPPMPVIHNVFSLAPYQEYLERAKELSVVPDGMGTEELSSEDMVLDLSLKKELVEAGETQRPTGCAERTLDREDKEEEKEAEGGKVGLGEGAQPRLPEVDSGERSSFQSSATFMFQKYKLPPSLLPSSEPPRQDGSPHPPPAQPSQQHPHADSRSLLPSQQPPGPTTWPPAQHHRRPKPSPDPSSHMVRQVGGVPAQTPSGQYFTTLHTCLCDTISGSVSRSSPELLQQWLKKAEPIWLAFQDVAVLLANLLSQLEAFMFACPFPHVVRAGAIFIPIHVVKEKLFPKLPGSFVDQVLQKHKVELRPTTLSEEKHLRDLELKSCTSRMLKLLALKQLPEIYPDLLNLHWHNSIQQQLGPSSQSHGCRDHQQPCRQMLGSHQHQGSSRMLIPCRGPSEDAAQGGEQLSGAPGTHSDAGGLSGPTGMGSSPSRQLELLFFEWIVF